MPQRPRPGEPTGQDERIQRSRQEALEQMLRDEQEVKTSGRRSPPRGRDREASALKTAKERKLAAFEEGRGSVLTEQDVQLLGDFDFEDLGDHSVPNRPINPPGYRVVEGLDPVELLEREMAAKRAAEREKTAQPPMGPAPGGAPAGGQGGQKPRGGGQGAPGGGQGQGRGGPAQQPPMPMMPPQMMQPQPQTTAPPPMAPVDMGQGQGQPSRPPPGQLNLEEFDPNTRFGGEQGPGPLSQLKLQQNEINQRQNNIDMTLQQISMMMEQMQGVITTFQQQLQETGQLTQQQQAQLQQVMQQVGATMGPMMPPQPGETPGGPPQGPQQGPPQGQPPPAQAGPPPEAAPPPQPPARGPQEGLQMPPGIQTSQERGEPGGGAQAGGSRSPNYQGSIAGSDDKISGPDVDVSQAGPEHVEGAPEPEPEPMPSSDTIEEQTELHPLKLKEMLDQSLGPDWVLWEPETLHQTLAHHIGQPPDAETFQMIQAIQVLIRTDHFWENWQGFEKIVLALNGITPELGQRPAQPGEPESQVDFDQIEPLSPGQMIFASNVALRLSPTQRPFNPEVLAFIAVQLQEAGLVWAPPPLHEAQSLLDQLHQGAAVPDPQLVEAKFTNMKQIPIEQAPLSPEHDPVDSQVIRLMAARDYVALKEAEYGAVQPQ